MVSRIMLFFMVAMSAVSLYAAEENQRFDSQLLSTAYRFSIPSNALPEQQINTDIIVDINVQAKFSVYSLMGEPVVFCSATWQLAGLGGLNLSDIPPAVLQKVELYNLHLELNFPQYYAFDCDVGVPYPNGSAKASFNIPTSPEWPQLFHNTAVDLTTEAFRKKEIRWNYTETQAKALLAQIFQSTNQAVRLRVLDAYIDVSPIKYYLLEQQQKEYQKIQASLTKHSQSNHEQNDEDIFSQVVEKAFVEKQIQQVSKKITQSRDTSTSTESAASINHEKKQRLQQQCAGFDMPAMSLEQVKLSDNDLSACRSYMDISYREPEQWHKEGLAIMPHWLTPALKFEFSFKKDKSLMKDYFLVSFVGHPKKVTNIDEYHRTMKDFKDVALSALKRDTDIHDLMEQCKGELSNICRMSYWIDAERFSSINNDQYLHWAGYEGPISYIGKESCTNKWAMDNYAQCKYMPERYLGAWHVILVAE